MAVSEIQGMLLKASVSDYLSKQRSDAKYEGIETYVDKWGVESIKGERELSELEMLIEEVKLSGNWLLGDCL